jgi:hypothetical protein
VLLCEETQSAAVLPIFFSHEGLATTWKRLGRTDEAGAARPVPTRLNILDLRLLVDAMLKPYSESQVDWTVARFVGLESASHVIASSLNELDAVGGVGSGRGSGDAAALHAEAAARKAAARAADPELDPPALAVAESPPPLVR